MRPFLLSTIDTRTLKVPKSTPATIAMFSSWSSSFSRVEQKNPAGRFQSSPLLTEIMVNSRMKHLPGRIEA
jgi:hypothetical protein